MAKPVPEGSHTITPHLVINGASEAIEFYTRVFGAKELMRMPFPGPGNQMKLGHAALQIGDSQLYLADEFPESGTHAPKESSPVSIHLYVPNADETFARAVDAGATVLMPLTDMFWGDRFGKIKDPFGHQWSIATHIEDVSPEEMMQRMKAAFGGPSSGKC
jgi:uncharacterized glyoxalase superfamily protein PhnB